MILVGNEAYMERRGRTRSVRSACRHPCTLQGGLSKNNGELSVLVVNVTYIAPRDTRPLQTALHGSVLQLAGG